MKVLIIEDEKHASDYLEKLLTEVDESLDIVAKLDTVKRSVEWLKGNQADLIFMDIHLADDISFNIFHQVPVNTPVIFTTAYDQYALRAFKVQSIDYLVKPIEKSDIERALEKYKNLTHGNGIDVESIKSIISESRQKAYQKRFLVKQGTSISSIKVADIAYFEAEDQYTYLVRTDGKRFFVDYKLSSLSEMLDPTLFFRLNRSFIAHFDSIVKIVPYSKSRVKVSLNPEANREIVVSYANVGEFKAWLNQ